ncbi:MAG TPA: hypothetical protein VGN23_13095 [Verrucomicrobiae bacterium]|jgi:hypothetical protein
MRTKALLMAAAALAAGIATSNAQVYSQNVVGYVSVNLTNGENLIANPMDLDGTGTNNTLQSVFGTNLPNTTKVYVFTSGGWQSASYVASSGKWLGSAIITNEVNAALNPGYGVFVDVPGSSGTSITLSEVGNVLNGPVTNNIAAGVTVLSGILPIGGTIDTNNGYVPSKGDKVYTWNVAAQNYGATVPNYTGSKWLGGDPVLTPGVAVFVSAASNTVWGVNFTNN